MTAAASATCVYAREVLAPPVTHSGQMVCNKRMAGACKSGLLTYGHNEIQECYCFDENYDEGGKRCVLVLPVLNAGQGIGNQSKCVCGERSEH